MTKPECKNKWYLYWEDLNGDQLFEFEEREELIRYLCEDAMTLFLPEGVSEVGKIVFQKIVQCFRNSKLDNYELGEELTMLVKANRGKVRRVFVDDFRNLISGFSESGVLKPAIQAEHIEFISRLSEKRWVRTKLLSPKRLALYRKQKELKSAGGFLADRGRTFGKVPTKTRQSQY